MKKKSLLERAKEEHLALTYNDVRLRTGYSEVMPDDINLESKFSRNVGLKVPIVSAAMDTVTEHRLATAMAKLGGLGIIHKNFTIEDHIAEIHRVKHHLNALIAEPVTIFEDETMADVLGLCERKGYSFHSFPVLNRSGKLVGIISGNEFDMCKDTTLKISEIMVTDLITGEENTDIKGAFEKMREGKIRNLPIVDGKGALAGLYVFSDVERVQSGAVSSFNVDGNGQLRVGAAIGAGAEAVERATALAEANVDVLVVDTAHGDSKGVIDTVKEIKRLIPNTDVVAGNISIGESAKRLADAGADGVKVGQGPGSICTTRVIAGIGRPQVSAVYGCASALAGTDIPVCADGGMQNSGDIPIAIAAGAHSVMMGSMLAGTEESPGDIVFSGGQQWKSYRGMGSVGAMESHKGSRERYGQKDVEKKSQLVPEGVEGKVPFKGHLEDIMVQYVGGLRRGMGYVGAADIEELRDKGDFDRITPSGFAESRPHDISITKEAPNYKGE